MFRYGDGAGICCWGADAVSYLTVAFPAGSLVILLLTLQLLGFPLGWRNARLNKFKSVEHSSSRPWALPSVAKHLLSPLQRAMRMPHSGCCTREGCHCISTINKTNNAATGLDFSQGMVLSPPSDQQHRGKALVSSSPRNPAAAAAVSCGWGNRRR